MADLVKALPCVQLYNKVLHDYLLFLPAYRIDEICREVQKNLPDYDFQILIDTLWKEVAAQAGNAS